MINDNLKIIKITGADDVSAPGRKFEDVVLTYPGAGHQIVSPYSSTSINYLTVGGGFIELLGGTPKANAIASEESFPKINEFLARALGMV